MEKSLTETEKTAEYQDEHLSVKATWKPGSQVSFEIHVTPLAAAAAYARALKAINKEVSFPGFRKGKAPDSVVVAKYPKQLQEEWLQTVLKTAFNDALKLANLQPFNTNSIRCSEVKELSRENGATFTIHFEASPVVPRIDLHNTHLHKVSRLPVTQRDVDQVIRNIQLYNASWTDVTDRPLQEGDFVDLDIESLEEPYNTICTDTRFEATKGVMADWMYKLLMGLKTNESAEGVSEKEDDSHNHHHDDDEDESGPAEFRPTHCRLTVKSIKQPDVPALDDAFAQKVGAKSLNELKEKISSDLNRRADDRVRNQMHRMLDAELLNHYRFDPPQSLVEAEIEHRAAIHRNWLEKQNAPAEDIEVEMQKLEQKLPEVVHNGLRLLFLLLGFAKEHSLAVSQEEIISEMTSQMAQGMQMPSGSEFNDFRARINQTLLLRKARDYIIEHVEADKK